MKKSMKYLVWSMVGIFLLYTIYSINHTPAYAQESSPSAGLSDKLKSLQDSIASKAAQIKDSISKKLKDKVYVGKVESKTTDTITLKFMEKTKRVKVTADTEYTATAKSLKSLVEGDYIVALGDTDQEGILTAKRVSKFTEKLDEDPVLIYGVVSDVGSSQITIKSKQNTENLISINSKTSYLFGDENSSLEDVKLQKAVIIIGTKIDEKSYRARTVYIYPYTSNLKTKTSTPSATPIKTTPTASPSAKPKR